MSDDLPDIDDLVTQDDLEDAIENVFTEYVDDSEPEVETTPDVDESMMDEIDDFVDKHEAAEVADQRVVKHLEHIVTEDCETEACNEIRRNLGLLPEEETEETHDHDHAEESADADHPETDEGAAESVEDTETDEGDATVGASDGEPDDAEADADAETEESGDTDDEDVETNIFGEPV